jgi:hypothetical protein
MTMATGARQDVRAYLDALEAQLEDLPPDERQEVLDDLQAHLAEVAAESDEPLDRRLGSPDAYAAELRASAGYGPARAASSGRVARMIRRWIDAVRSAPEAQPTWWVVRGLLLAPLVWQIGGGFPDHDGGLLGGVVLAAVGAALSVALGRRTASGQQRSLNIAVTVVALIALPMAFVQLRDAAQQRYVYVDDGAGQPPGFLQASDGRPIFNIYPFAADGTPLEGVLLYDQDGVPIDNLMPVEPYDDGSGPEQHPVRDANGNPIGNAYPRSLLIPDEGGPRPDRRPAVRIPPMAEQTTTTAPAPATTTAPPPQG